MPADFRFAICNEIFGASPFPEVCDQARETGFDGIELTPHLFTEQERDPREVRDQIRDAGLEFVGLHWLLVSPPGLHITSGDRLVLRRSWDHVARMIDICAELAGCSNTNNGLLVIGSPKQRASTGGADRKRAVDTFVHELAHMAPHAESTGVTLLVEAIPERETDVVNRLDEAVAIVREIGSPSVRTMFDVHNAADENETHPQLIERFYPYIRHIHVNEENGAEPGMGRYDFESLFSALSRIHYQGWISVEAFDFSRPPLEIARRAFERLQNAAKRN